METVIYTYELSQAANGKANFEKLNLEIRASTVPDYKAVHHVNGKIYVEVESELAADKKTELDGIIAGHDGAEAEVAQRFVDAREKRIREMSEMAIYHPGLDTDHTVEYLTYIDNHLNAWKRTGINSVVIAKITADAGDTSNANQHAFLNAVVNEAGNKTFEFLIGEILKPINGG